MLEKDKIEPVISENLAPPDTTKNLVDRRTFLAFATLLGISLSKIANIASAEDDNKPKLAPNSDPINRILYPHLVLLNSDHSSAKVTFDAINTLLINSSGFKALSFSDQEATLKRIEEQICKPHPGFLNRERLLDICDAINPNPLNPALRLLPEGTGEKLDAANQVLGVGSTLMGGAGSFLRGFSSLSLPALLLSGLNVTIGAREQLYEAFNLKQYYPSFAFQTVQEELLSLHFELYTTNESYREYVDQVSSSLVNGETFSSLFQILKSGF